MGIQANAGESIAIEDCVSRNVHCGAALNSSTTAFKVTGGVFEGNDTSLIIRAGSNQVSIDALGSIKPARTPLWMPSARISE